MKTQSEERVSRVQERILAAKGPLKTAPVEKSDINHKTALAVLQGCSGLEDEAEPAWGEDIDIDIDDNLASVDEMKEEVPFDCYVSSLLELKATPAQQPKQRQRKREIVGQLASYFTTTITTAAKSTINVVTSTERTQHLSETKKAEKKKERQQRLEAIERAREEKRVARGKSYYEALSRSKSFLMLISLAGLATFENEWR